MDSPPCVLGDLVIVAVLDNGAMDEGVTDDEDNDDDDDDETVRFIESVNGCWDDEDEDSPKGFVKDVREEE